MKNEKLEEWEMSLWGFSHSFNAMFLGLTTMVGLK
jgi:hypothetical protein